MKAAILTAPWTIGLEELPDPEPGPAEVVLRVEACGLNRADVIVASGRMHGAQGGAGARLGQECAGTVLSVGPGVTEYKPGDRVMGTTAGAFAELALCHTARLMPVPDDLETSVAATLPVAVTTMHDALVTNGTLAPGETVMIQGASSGVGLMGLQIAKLFGASFVIGTSTNAERRARLTEFGANLAVDTADPAWPDRIAAERPNGIDVIVDQVSAGVSDGNLKVAATQARIVNVGRLGGFRGDFDFDLHAFKRIRYIGVTFRTRTLDEVRDVYRRAQIDLWPALQSGKLRLPIDSSYELRDSMAALLHVKCNKHFGKVVLRIN